MEYFFAPISAQFCHDNFLHILPMIFPMDFFSFFDFFCTAVFLFSIFLLRGVVVCSTERLAILTLAGQAADVKGWAVANPGPGATPSRTYPAGGPGVCRSGFAAGLWQYGKQIVARHLFTNIPVSLPQEIKVFLVTAFFQGLSGCHAMHTCFFCHRAVLHHFSLLWEG